MNIQDFVRKVDGPVWDMEFKVPFEEGWVTRWIDVDGYRVSNYVTGSNRMSIVSRRDTIEKLINWRLVRINELDQLDIAFWWTNRRIVLVFSRAGERIVFNEQVYMPIKPVFYFEFCSETPFVTEQDIPDRTTAEKMVRESTLFRI